MESAVVKRFGLKSNSSNHIKRSDVSISNAQKNLNGLTEMDAHRLVKIWMDHLKGAKEEVVSLLFKDRATAAAGLANQPLTRVYNNLYDPWYDARLHRFH